MNQPMTDASKPDSVVSQLRDFRFAFGEVRHARLRPVAHSFRYAAFFLRVPIHRLDGASLGNWLFGVNRPALLSFHERDHGDSAAARIWIRAMLREARIRADGEIWLHTFPRVLGFSFKPVSFWFCHNRAGQLLAVVAEVNNTFGERHCYLLSSHGGEPIGQGQLMQADKNFHVSPFCDVTGGYRFRFFNRDDRCVARIEYHDPEGPLLLTSLHGHMATPGVRTSLRALLGYPLFTLGVIARIHWHALLLWFKRVRWYRKPAAPEQFTTRGSA